MPKMMWPKITRLNKSSALYLLCKGCFGTGWWCRPLVTPRRRSRDQHPHFWWTPCRHRWTAHIRWQQRQTWLWLQWTRAVLCWADLWRPPHHSGFGCCSWISPQNRLSSCYQKVPASRDCCQWHRQRCQWTEPWQWSQAHSPCQRWCLIPCTSILDPWPVHLF